MKFANNILETIGNTPLVRLNTITKEIPALVLAKVESFNPGNSVKDRMALKMVEDAEADGRLKPGGTIVEGTSGNTGMGLALAAIVKGYKLICVSTDKQSKEKFDVLRAVGAEVVVCPTDVTPDDPRSYYSTSKRIAEETPMRGMLINTTTLRMPKPITSRRARDMGANCGKNHSLCCGGRHWWNNLRSG